MDTSALLRQDDAAKSLLLEGLIDEGEYAIIARASERVARRADTIQDGSIKALEPKVLACAQVEQHNLSGTIHENQPVLQDVTRESNQNNADCPVHNRTSSRSWFNQIRQSWSRSKEDSNNDSCENQRERTDGGRGCKRKRQLGPDATLGESHVAQTGLQPPPRKLRTQQPRIEPRHPDTQYTIEGIPPHAQGIPPHAQNEMRMLRDALPCLAAMPTHLLYMVLNGRGCTKVGYCAKEMIVQNHEEEHTAHVVYQGEVAVTSDATAIRRKSTYGPGYVFGCNALLTGTAQPATVIALTNVTLLVISRDKLRRFLLSQRGCFHAESTGAVQELDVFTRHTQSHICRNSTKMNGENYTNALNQAGLTKSAHPILFITPSSTHLYCQQQHRQHDMPTRESHDQHLVVPSSTHLESCFLFTPLNALYQQQYRHDLMHHTCNSTEISKKNGDNSPSSMIEDNAATIILQGQLYKLSSPEQYDKFYSRLLQMIGVHISWSTDATQSAATPLTHAAPWLLPLLPVLGQPLPTKPASRMKTSTLASTHENVKAIAAQVLLAASRCIKDRCVEMGGEGHSITQMICQHPSVLVRPEEQDLSPVEISLASQPNSEDLGLTGGLEMERGGQPSRGHDTVIIVQSSCRYVAVHVDKSRGEVAEWATFRTSVTEIMSALPYCNTRLFSITLS